MSKMRRMIKVQLKARFMNAILASILCIFYFTSHLGWNFTSFILAGVTARLVFYLLSKLSSFLIKKIFYGSDYAAMLIDSSEMLDEIYSPNVEEFAVIQTDAKRIGTFQDQPFFEWIDIEGKDGRTHRAIYFGTMDISRNERIPSDCIMVPPGILYQVQGPVT